MDFYVVQRPRRGLGPYPYATLETDNWDDYGYKTLYHLKVYLADEEFNVGVVKIAELGMSDPYEGKSRADLEQRFQALGDTYVSLGQDYGYYEVLASLSQPLRQELLTSLQDAAYLSHKVPQFEQEGVWATSLLRFGAAENALLDGRRLIGTNDQRGVGQSKSLPASIEFWNPSGDEDTKVVFRFRGNRYFTTRVNAIIGYNGAGKTQLLANLGQVAHADHQQRQTSRFQGKYGSFGKNPPTYAATIMVSYSAFDTFAWPESSKSRNEDESFGFSYTGLRADTHSDTEHHQSARLKSNTELRDEFAQALARIKELGRNDVLQRALTPLGMEPSFNLNFPLSSLHEFSSSDAAAYYDTMSTGHKISLNIIAHLVMRLQPKSLVLIDEPEAHLHPSLLAALLQSLTLLLDTYESHAVVSTHSPVVLQEIPARCVQVVTRIGQRMTIRKPALETFGENIGIITAHAFHLNSSSTDFHVTLDKLAAERTPLDDVDAMFEYGLSTEARSYYLSRLHDEGDGHLHAELE